MAPKSDANAPFSGMRSTAMIWLAPHSFAAWMTLRPTPPAPMTTQVSPSWRRARLKTAPVPVITPQPMSAAAVSGISFGIGTHWFSPTMVSWTKAPIPAKLYSGCSPSL